uniref:Large ribosomal subunit protein bL35c n=1 Tax=Trichogloeopsis pedicellata TaxID=1495610 RepID=A0A1G4P0L3_9FLOR|nr:Ribosomal protein L35 [Trichogloeopsis pedicellata]SCW24427.1 Ribosomal protein L35 [Trichogloeopsis pedicellata]
MPKLKTSSSITKRFKITGNQRVFRRRACKSHLLEKKTQSRKKRLSRVVQAYSGDLRGLRKKYFI